MLTGSLASVLELPCLISLSSCEVVRRGSRIQRQRGIGAVRGIGHTAGDDQIRVGPLFWTCGSGLTRLEAPAAASSS
jgi:hypothetical protein